MANDVIEPVRTVGRGASVFVSVVFQVGPVGVQNLRQSLYDVHSVLQSIDFGVDVGPRATAGAIVLDFTIEHESEVDRVCNGLQLLPERFSSMARVQVEPVKSPAELMDMIVFGAENFPDVEGDLLNRVPLFVAVTAGRASHPHPTEYATLLRTRVLEALGSRPDAPIVGAVSPAASETSVRQRWIQLPQQSSSLVRWYRPLPAPSTRDEALARSIGNACLGGTPSSRIYRLLSEQLRYSYNPSIFIRQVNGRQWMVLDVATASEFEVPVETEIRALFAATLESPPQETEIRDAAKYMFTQKRIMLESPQIANLAALAIHDGSDPWDLTNVRPQDVLTISREMVAAEMRKVYVTNDCLRLVVSPMAEPVDWATQ